VIALPRLHGVLHAAVPVMLEELQRHGIGARCERVRVRTLCHGAALNP